MKRPVSPCDRHQLRVLRDTVRNPLKSLLGGPTLSEAMEILVVKFGYTKKDLDLLAKR